MGREVSRCKLVYIGWINNKVLLFSTRNYVQYPLMNHNGKEDEKEHICTYAHTHICTHAHVSIYMYAIHMYSIN